MKYFQKNKQGLTLIEVLAVTVIISIVAILIFSIIQSSLELRSKQTKETNELFDITYALKLVTKDIRRSIAAEAKITELKLTFPDSKSDNSVTYLFEDHQLKKKTIRDVNGLKTETEELITNGIGCAEFKPVENNVISIKLSNTSDCSHGQNTEIHLRNGGK